MQVVGQVRRIEIGDVEEFRRATSELSQPVVLCGGLTTWPAFKHWSPEYLSRLLGERLFFFKRSSSNAHPDFRRTEMREMFAREQLNFGQFAERIIGWPVETRSHWLFTGDEHFLYRVRQGLAELNPALAELWPDVQVPKQIPLERLYSVWAWFSGKGVRTWLHYDNNGCHNLNAQVSGSKQAWLFPPSELDKLATFPLAGPNPAVNCSQIDVDAPDLSRFPEFLTAKALEVTVSAGELLFIPGNWLHAFAHLGDFNANVNFWWKPDVELTDAVARRETARLQQVAERS